jgi:hypothetical protein
MKQALRLQLVVSEASAEKSGAAPQAESPRNFQRIFREASLARCTPKRVHGSAQLNQGGARLWAAMAGLLGGLAPSPSEFDIDGRGRGPMARAGAWPQRWLQPPAIGFFEQASSVAGALVARNRFDCTSRKRAALTMAAVRCRGAVWTVARPPALVLTPLARREVASSAPHNGNVTATGARQKAKKSADANLLTLVMLGSSTWARTRDLRINSF